MAFLKVYTILSFFALGALALHDCTQLKLLYEELHCTPVFDKQSDKCPTFYDCSNYEKVPKNKCPLQGKIYNDGDIIRDDTLMTNCLPECRCMQEYGVYAVSCIMTECPEWLEPMVSPGCKAKYDLKSCCMIGEVCPEKEHLVQCKFGNNTYLEGSRYSSEDRESTCICTKSNDGKPKNECRRNICVSETVFRKELDAYCAPLYVSKFNMCPVSMYCPAENETKIKFNDEDTFSKCRFGNELWNIGESADKNMIKNNKISALRCECKIPPYVECHYKDTYNH